MKKSFIIKHGILTLLSMYLFYIGFEAVGANSDARPGTTIMLIGIAGLAYEIYVYRKNTGTDRWY